MTGLLKPTALRIEGLRTIDRLRLRPSRNVLIRRSSPAGWNVTGVWYESIVMTEPSESDPW